MGVCTGLLLLLKASQLQCYVQCQTLSKDVKVENWCK